MQSQIKNRKEKDAAIRDQYLPLILYLKYVNLVPNSSTLSLAILEFGFLLINSQIKFGVLLGLRYS